MVSANAAEIWVSWFHLKKNLRSHCFFPKLLSSSTNKLKRSFQTTSPMQIITKPSFDMDLIAHCEKDFPSDP